MVTKIRKQIYIEPHQDIRLKQLAQELGLSEAELIRQAIEQQTQRLFKPRPDPQAWEQERAYIQDLLAQGPVSGGRTWQREALYDR